VIDARMVVTISKPAMKEARDSTMYDSQCNISPMTRNIAERANGNKPKKLYKESVAWSFIDETVRRINIPAVIVTSA
jgi:hypothetical protein